MPEEEPLGYLVFDSLEDASSAYNTQNVYYGLPRRHLKTYSFIYPLTNGKYALMDTRDALSYPTHTKITQEEFETLLA